MVELINFCQKFFYFYLKSVVNTGPLTDGGNMCILPLTSSLHGGTYKCLFYFWRLMPNFGHNLMEGIVSLWQLQESFSFSIILHKKNSSFLLVWHFGASLPELMLFMIWHFGAFSPQDNVCFVFSWCSMRLSVRNSKLFVLWTINSFYTL